ncbi:MAG TPA: aromatic amino acid ammonia-lyase [Solirubrobacteraceae bacterium]|nr:aromatic amino acid ammonia-lyase [Solirubrobacteraceae bacterium]
MIRLERPGDLDLERYRRVAGRGERIAIAPELLAAVDASRAPMLARLEGGAVAYGVTTGLGHLARTAIPAGEQLAFQRSLLMRGAGTGPPFPPDVARGALLIRLAGFLHGAAGVSAALCATIADRLNDGWAPVVPSQGITSAGEVIALSHLVQPLLGAGEVLVGGEVLPAAVALDRAGAAPYAPGLKEGIALINGAPLAPALGAHLGARAAALLDAATVAGALTATLAGQSSRPYSPRIGRLKGDPAQVRVLERLGALGAGTGFEERPQGPVSFRVLPQVHGAVLELADRLEELVGRELRGVSDSPLILTEADGEPAGFYPSGNFHPAAIALALDGLTSGIAQVGNLALQRIHRLLDARYTGLTDQLAVEPGRQSGVTFAHKAALSHVAELRRLAAPAGVQMFDGSTGQEDVQSMAFLAADQLGRALDALEQVLAAELVAARQAHHLRGRPLPPMLEAAVERVAAVVGPVEDDRSLAADLAAARDVLRSGLA